MKLFLATSLIFLLQGDLQRKTIKQGDYNIICYVTDKNTTPKHGREYYWFKSGEIHSTFNGIGGLLLDHDFIKYYKSKQLAEKGSFKLGLKNGKWKTWFKNGHLKNSANWKKGLKNGSYYEYNEDGSLKYSGTFRNNKKVKQWINHNNNDTLYYGRDTITKTKPKSKLSVFLKKLFNNSKDN